MRSDPESTRQDVSTSKSTAIAVVAAWILMLCTLAGCRKQPSVQGPSKSLPPNLSDCTCIELEYRPSTLGCLFLDEKKKPSILSAAEIQYLQSMKTIIVHDRERIETFARNVSAGSYSRSIVHPERVGMFQYIHFVCYHGSRSPMSFSNWGTEIVTQDGHVFEYEGKPLRIVETLTPQILPFRLRQHCASNLAKLRNDLRTYCGAGRGYPPPSEWSDALVQDRRDRKYSKERVMEYLTCPSAGEGQCHYAMNPNCKLDSPPDVVLLFETKAGWNQHGGPEVFSFDNHEPKGGCVKLNDGTVKFIRTKDELEQLRWKE